MQDWVQAGWMDPSWVSEWVPLKVMRVQHVSAIVRSPRFSHDCMVYVYISASVLFSNTLKMEVNIREQMHVCVIGLCSRQSPPCDIVLWTQRSRKNFCFFKIKRSLTLWRNIGGFVWVAHSPWVGQNSSNLLLFMSLLIRVWLTARRAIAPRFSQFGDLYCDQTFTTIASQTQADLWCARWRRSPAGPTVP